MRDSPIRYHLFLILVLLLPASIQLNVANVPTSISSTEESPLNKVVGVQSIAVILVEFTNVHHAIDSANIEDRLVQMKSYYHSTSYGRVTVAWSITGWYTLNQTLEFYGNDTDKAQKGHENGKLLLDDSVRVARDDVDFRQFRHVAVVHAGLDQRVSKNASDLWPHYFEVTVNTKNDIQKVGGFYVSERSQVGIYVHELAHSFGLPDLYPPDERPRIVGNWSLMDRGEWLGEPPGSSPSGLDSWSLIQLGWIEPCNTSVRTGLATVTILPLEAGTGTRVVRINLDMALYYLIELRARRGVDVALPGEGLVISLVNETARTPQGAYGTVNSTAVLLPPWESWPIFEDTIRHVFVELVDCTRHKCTVRISSVLAVVASSNLSDIPSSMEAFAQFELAAVFWDHENKPLPGLNVTLLIDKEAVQLVTDASGEIRHTLSFSNLGQHKIKITVPAVLWPPTPLVRSVDVVFPYTVVRSIVLPCIVGVCIGYCLLQFAFWLRVRLRSRKS